MAVRQITHVYTKETNVKGVATAFYMGDRGHAYALLLFTTKGPQRAVAICYLLEESFKLRYYALHASPSASVAVDTVLVHHRPSEQPLVYAIRQYR